MDEVPRCTTIQKIKEHFAERPFKKNSQTRRDAIKSVVALDMPNFSCQLNRTASTRWTGPAKAVPYWVLNHFSVNDIHLLHLSGESLFTLWDAGWHFNTMGNWKMAIEKWMCHNIDLANNSSLNESQLKQNYDDFLARHRPIPIDESFPKLVRKNLEYYKSIGWIAEY